MSPATEPNPAGETITVHHRDGCSEEVFIRRVPKSEFTAYGLAATALSDLDELRFYVPGRSPEWWASLDDNSLQTILDTGIALIESEFRRWFARGHRNLKLVGGETAPLSIARQMVAANPALLNPDAASRKN